jgi:hypothetical protein
MSKIWYCPTCGYEVGSRGRCHRCKAKLVASPLPELPPAAEEDEVGYRLDDWEDEQRVQLIQELISQEIGHRFEDEELVVAVDDEERVDALVSELAGDLVAAEDEDGGGDEVLDEHPADGERLPPGITPEVAALDHAAARLAADPTDMMADAEASETSTSVFLIEDPPGVDTDTWNAVGRVTRRLMAALGADEALEDEIRAQAGILHRLLGPIVAPGAPAGSPAGNGATAEDAADRSETVYELGEWLPEQRAELALRLEEQHIPGAWDGPDLVVPSDREADVEAVLDRIEAVQVPDADEEATYRAMEELFAATNRFVSDPADRTRGNEVVRAVGVADGPTPVGLDDAQWWQIRQRARILADSIEHKAQKDVVLTEARTLRDLLRGLM